MDGLAAVVFGQLDDAGAVEVLVCAAEVDGEGRGEGVLGARVGVCVEGCGADAGLGGRAVDAEGDFAAVRDED